MVNTFKNLNAAKKGTSCNIAENDANIVKSVRNIRKVLMFVM